MRGRAPRRSAAELVGAVGPGAGPCCYEVGDDVGEPLQAALRRPTSCATAAPTCGVRPARARGGRASSGWRSPASARSATRTVLLAPARPRRHRPSGRRRGAACLIPRVVAANLARIRDLGRARRSRSWPRPSTSTQTTCRALREAGVTLVGENRTDALIPKQERFGDLFTWDFIGHVQSRKVRDLVGRVRLIHAVDSLSVCEQLDRRGQPETGRLPAAGERRRGGHEVRRRARRGGRVPGAVEPLARRALPRV